MLLWAIPGLFSPQGFFKSLQFLAIRVIHTFGFYVPIFFSKCVLFPFHSVGGMSLCILHLYVGRIFSRCFGISCFDCNFWPCFVFVSLAYFPNIFWFIFWNRFVCFVIPIVIGALGTATKGLERSLNELEIRGKIETIPTTVLLRSAWILCLNIN